MVSQMRSVSGNANSCRQSQRGSTPGVSAQQKLACNVREVALLKEQAVQHLEEPQRGKVRGANADPWGLSSATAGKLCMAARALALLQ